MTLVTLATAWVVGLLVGMWTDGYVPALALFSVAALSLTYVLRSWGVSPWPGLLALVLVMGVLRVEVSERSEGLTPVGGLQSISMRGLVDDNPELSGPGVEFVVAVEEADTGKGWEQTQGKVLVTARPPEELVQTRDAPYFRYGDRLELKGHLEHPPELGGFDYGAYLATQGVRSVMPFPEVQLLDERKGNSARERIYSLRRELSERLDTAVPEPQSSLAQALLLGLRGRMPPEIKEDFRDTGTSHLLAISGLHVGVLMMLSLGVSALLIGRRHQLYLAVPFGTIWLYAVLSGFSPPVERAAIMGSIYLLGLALGRPKSILPALALAAAVMAALEPALLERVSFQLSFAAMAGIAVLTTSELPTWTQFGKFEVDPKIRTGG